MSIRAAIESQLQLRIYAVALVKSARKSSSRTRQQAQTQSSLTTMAQRQAWVSLVQAVCAPYSEDYNHWFINLQITNRVTTQAGVQTFITSERFNLAIDDDKITNYERTTSNWQITGRAIHHVDFNPKAYFQPDHVHQLIRNADLHLFEYSEQGSGCRHWV